MFTDVTPVGAYMNAIKAYNDSRHPQANRFEANAPAAPKKRLFTLPRKITGLARAATSDCVASLLSIMHLRVRSS